MSIAERLNQIRLRIAEAAAKAGRDPHAVRLVAVSKTRPPRMLWRPAGQDRSSSARTTSRS